MARIHIATTLTLAALALGLVDALTVGGAHQRPPNNVIIPPKGKPVDAGGNVEVEKKHNAVAKGGQSMPLQRDLDRLKRASSAAIQHRLKVGAPATVPAVNISAFHGRWYQVYQDAADAGVAQCTTVDYGADHDHPTHMVMATHYTTLAGDGVAARAWAQQPYPEAAPGKFVVHVDGATALLPMAFWVVLLGPLNARGQYEYAVVTDEFRLSLTVLARDAARFAADYDEKVLSWLASHDFDQWFNKPAKVDHQNCNH